MIDAPQITQATAQSIAIIHLTVPRSEMRSATGPGISEVMAAVKAQGIGPAGPWFTHHLKMDPATFDFEICVPVTAPVVAVGRVTLGKMPAVRIARTVYHGPYERLGAAWGEIHGLDRGERACRGSGDSMNATLRGRSRAPTRPTGARNSASR